MPTGWGSGPWGSSPWGAALPASPPTGAAVASVKSLDLRRVRVQFNAGVDPSALEAYPYVFASLSVPAYNPTVKSARFINGPGIVLNSLVELYLENCLSLGVSYELTITGVIGVPAGSATFVAFSPNWPATRRMELWDVIPRINKVEDESEHLERFILCIQDQLDTTLSFIDNWPNILDPDLAEERFLDLMLADLGNPFRIEELTESDKRLLVRLLVKIYQLKGTDVGIIAALRFFMKFESQISLFRQTGAKLGKAGTIRSRLDDTFVLGGGTAYDFALTVATTDPPGRALTAQEESRISKIVDYMKAVNERFLKPIFYGLVGTERMMILGSSLAVSISWQQTEVVPDYWRVYSRTNTPRVSPFNTARYTEVAGGITTATLYTPFGTDPLGTNYYFTVVPVYQGRKGFTSKVEVRNNLLAPSGVLATGGIRKVTVTWASMGDATSYVVYKTLHTTASSSLPIVADFRFEVLGGETSFVDEDVLPGEVVHYCVVARVGDAEGAFSLSVTGTAT
jgi:phage tail-like protein